jgi:hypothetical protein
MILFFYTPCLIFWGLIVPLSFVIYLKKNLLKLHQVNFNMKFGFIYHEYRSNCFYWEIFKTYIKCFIFFISVYYKGYLKI